MHTWARDSSTPSPIRLSRYSTTKPFTRFVIKHRHGFIFIKHSEGVKENIETKQKGLLNLKMKKLCQ